MLKEFVEKLESMAFRSGEVKLADHPDPHKKIVSHNGGYDVIDKPQHRHHAAYDLETIVSFAIPDGEIWYSSKQVVCYPQAAERINRLAMDFSFSKPFLFFVDLDAKPKTFSQRDLIFTLRTTLAKCQSKCPHFLKLLRDLRFTSGSTDAASIQHGKSSVGKTIQREATGQDAIPEEIVFNVPIFMDKVACFADIECAVDVDAGTQTIQLVPLPGQVEAAKASAEWVISKRLLEFADGVKIYHGVP